MQIILQPLNSSDGNPVRVDTSIQSSVASLISSYCTQKGIAFNSKLVIYDSKRRPLPQFSTLASLGLSNGQKLLIGCSERSFKLRENWPILVAGIALLIGVVGIITISLVYGLTGGKYPLDYGVVMDAGSSKTNTIVYKWQSNKHKGTGCVTQEENCFAKGGIAEMDPMDLSLVINCTKKVTSHINPATRPKTPLYFAATAGMRLLNLTNPEKVEQILGHLDVQLNETGLSVKEIEIISGRDEGIYGWITANFLEQTLEIPQKVSPWVPTTYGALDMGGASMQIAYSLSAKDENSTSTLGIQLYGQTHNVLSISNLCFGRDQAEKRYRFLLVKNVSITTIEDPCLAEGFIYNISGTDLLSQPCTESDRFADELARNKSILNNVYNFIGTSSPLFCKKNVSELLNDDLCKKYGFKECFKKLYIPDDQKFLAFATYYFTTNFLNITKGSLTEYENAVENYCAKNISEVIIISNSSYATQYCFNAMYIHEALVNGFGFDESTWKNLEFVSKIAGKDVGWTLGYMINATNFIPTKAPLPRLISVAALTLSLILFIIVVIATVVYVYHHHRKGNTGETQPFGKA